MKVDGLIENIIFGPVHSRRYGRSLGVNPLPAAIKLCNFNCPYCECGWTDVPQSRQADPAVFPPADAIAAALRSALQAAREAGEPIDNVTFAGNGEPTLHPEFPALAERARDLRDELAPAAGLIILTNATTLHQPAIVAALAHFDETVCKLDAGTTDFFRQIALPITPLDLDWICAGIRQLPAPTIQSMFVAGRLCNTGAAEVEAWLARLKTLRPRAVQVYSIERKAPDPRLRPVAPDTLRGIAERVRREAGLPAEVF